MNVCGLNIDFPEIYGQSDRQIEYAENLREVYVTRHEERFQDIADMVEEECDYRMQHNFDDGATHTFFEEFTEAEKACLYGTFAGGIIATLKEALNR